MADAARSTSLLAAYDAVRPLTAAERRLLPAMARAGALRFWISRLWDLHLPREASMLKAHDPGHFERVLRQRVDVAAAGGQLHVTDRSCHGGSARPPHAIADNGGLTRRGPRPQAERAGAAAP